MRLIIAILPLFVLISCNKNFKERIGIVTTGPNEYEVTRNKGLEVPPSYDLPIPVNN